MKKQSEFNLTITRPLELLARLLMAAVACGFKLGDEDVAALSFILILWLNHYKNRGEKDEQEINDRILLIIELSRTDNSEARKEMLNLLWGATSVDPKPHQSTGEEEREIVKALREADEESIDLVHKLLLERKAVRQSKKKGGRQAK